MKKNIFLIIIIIFIYACKKPLEGIKPIEITRPFKRALWVVRHSIATKEKAKKLIKFAYKNNINKLIIQIRGRGDAYYDSVIEPRAFDLEKDFDPLSFIIKNAKKYNIEVHAWLNVVFAANLHNRKVDDIHILSKHPEWATYDKWGKSLLTYSNEKLKKNLIEGVFVDPAIVDFKNHFLSIIKDILSRYEIHGIHLDFIRYPYSGYNGYYKKFLKDFGYNPEARMQFIEEYGIDPVYIPRKKPNILRELWRDFRRDKITKIVKFCKEIIKLLKPEVVLSAAVIPNAPVVRNVYFQDWKDWLKKGYVDLIFPMSYDKGLFDFKNYIKIAKKIKDLKPTFMGIYIIPKTNIKLISEQIKIIYNEGFSGFCIFSYKYEEIKKQIELINKILIEKENIISKTLP